MDHVGVDGATWTGDRVEARLIAAFRALPSYPVFSDHSRVRATPGGSCQNAAALNWTRQFVTSRDDALALLTWARCKAQGDSLRAFKREAGGSRNTADRARKRALARIVACLRLEQLGLDSGANPLGA